MPRRIAVPPSTLTAPHDGDRGSRWGIGDLGSVAGLIALTVYFLAISWRKWPDPLIDFGVVLYTPWRLTEGAVLYRDIDCFYGPFSQYLNAAVFSAFGPSLMTMVALNLVIFAAILGTIYVCFRRAWGTPAAFIAGALFVAVFGFSQHVVSGNFNYCTPYATETTHGLLVCLLLVAVLARWVDEPGPRTSLLAGFLFGLTLVLKLEIMVAGAAAMLAALALRWWRHGRPPLAVWLAAAGGTVLPSVAFFGYFLIHLPVGDALRAAGNGWLVAINGQLTNNAMQQVFLGFDQPWVHFAEHLKATALALALLAGLGGAAWAGDRIGPRMWRYALCALVAAGLVWLASDEIAWPDIGRCLLGLALLYVATKTVMLFRARGSSVDSQGETMRVLLAVLAASLMARMALNGRIFHYGYYQAALAALLIPAVLVGEVGGWLRLKQGNAFLIAGAFALLTPGIVLLARHSHGFFKLKTLEVGEGADRFYALPKEVAPSTQLVRLALDFLRHQPPGQTVIVMPEGISINYLSRRPSPVPNFLFYGPSTLNGREAKLVEKLRQHPPDWVFLVSVNLLENGIARYGEKSGSGQELLQWLQEDYQRVAKTGGDPLDTRDPGAQIFARKAALR